MIVIFERIFRTQICSFSNSTCVFLIFGLLNTAAAQGPIDLGTLNLTGASNQPAEIQLSGGYKLNEFDSDYSEFMFAPLPTGSFEVIINLDPAQFTGEEYQLFAAIVAPGMNETAVTFTMRDGVGWVAIDPDQAVNSTEDLNTVLGGMPFSTANAEAQIQLPHFSSIISHPDVSPIYGDIPMTLFVGVAQGNVSVSDLQISSVTTNLYSAGNSAATLEELVFENIDGTDTASRALGAAFLAVTGVEANSTMAPNGDTVWLFDEGEEIDVLLHLIPDGGLGLVGAPARIYLLANVNGLIFIYGGEAQQWFSFDNTLEGLRHIFFESELSPIVPLPITRVEELVSLPGVTELESGGHAIFFFAGIGTGTGSNPTEIFYTPNGLGISIEN